MKTAVDWLTYMGFTIEEETERHVIVSHESVHGMIAVRNARGGTYVAAMQLKWLLGPEHQSTKKAKERFVELLKEDF